MEVHQSQSEQNTLEIARRVGSRLRAPQVILLYGELGSGKTVFARGLALGLGLADERSVRSPSFTLVNEYRTPLCTIHHVDLYRLESAWDFDSLGLEDLLSSDAVIIVEWGEKLPWELPHALKVRIIIGSDLCSRVIELDGLDD